MSAQFRTMADIESEIVYKFSVSGVSARHTQGASGRIRQLFNVAWAQLREIVSLASDGSYLFGTAPANLPTTAAVTGEVYAEIDFPTDAVAIHGVRVLTTTGGRWYNLKRVPFAAYQDYQSETLFGSFNRNRGPIAYTPRLLPDGSGATEVVGKIMIFPVPTSGQFRLWYLTAWTPKTANTDTFPGVAAFHQWAITQTMIWMLMPDSDSQKVYKMLIDERERLQGLIEARARRMDEMPLEPRDARGDGYDYATWRDDI